MINPRDVGQPEAAPRQKPQIANNIWATTSATAATDGIQHDATTHDAKTDDATTDSGWRL